MNDHMLDVIARFPDLNVLVIGDVILDGYLEGHSSRLCREAPVPVVSLTDYNLAPGGAANTAMNVGSLGARTSLMSVLGEDADGETLSDALEEAGIDLAHLFFRHSRRTIAKRRVVASSQILVRIDEGNTDPIDEVAERMLIERLDRVFGSFDAVIVSDYAYGLFTPRIIQELARLRSRHSTVLVVDSKRPEVFREVHPTAVKPNYEETRRLLQIGEAEGASRSEHVRPHGKRILELTGAKIAAVTLDAEGGIAFERGGKAWQMFARPASDSRANGAGDTFTSALALGLAAGASSAVATELAQTAAAVVVAKEGTALCSAKELRDSFWAADKYVDVQSLAGRLEAARREGQKIVFTNGCFDILHQGHITYLSRAKALGDILVVGLNSDESVRRLKGPDRPINSLEERAQVLASLSCIDHIVPFDGDTAIGLIRVVRPDVFVKGGDYTVEMLPEAPVVDELGGRVHIVPYVNDTSTTSLIERIRTASVDDAARLTAEGRGDR